MASEEEKRHPLGPIKRAGFADSEFSVSRAAIRRMLERARGGWEVDHTGPKSKFRHLGAYVSPEFLRRAEERLRSVLFNFEDYPDRLESTITEEEESLSLEESEELEVLLSQALHTLRGCDEVARRISASLDRVSDKTKDVSVAYRELLTP